VVHNFFDFFYRSLLGRNPGLVIWIKNRRQVFYAFCGMDASFAVELYSDFFGLVAMYIFFHIPPILFLFNLKIVDLIG
jgi:hypothetical protein